MPPSLNKIRKICHWSQRGHLATLRSYGDEKTKLLLIILTGFFASIGTATAENVSLLVEKGIFLQETKKDYVAAIDVYDKALKLAKPEGQLYEILYRMAMCSKGLGDDETQIEILEGIIESGDAENEWVKKAKRFTTIKKKLNAPSKEVNEIRDKILEATKTHDLALFHSVCNKTMEEFLTDEVFTPVADQLAETLKNGYKLEVKSVKKGIYDTYEWFVKCKDGSKFTMNMSLDKRGEVAGCWMR